MVDTNDKTDDVTVTTDDTTATLPDTTTTTPEPKPNRVTLTDEEQLAVLEGRTQRLRTKLGKNEPAKPAEPSGDLIQKTYLRAASITEPDEVKLALDTAKKWDMPLDQLVDDEDFKEKLGKLRTEKANDLATSGVSGGPAAKGATQTPEFYISRGTPPTPAEVPDRKTRVAIVKAMTGASKNRKTFYND
jgi:hypothetical protein